MNDKKQFVVYPHDENSEVQPNLTPKDKLIYVAIRRYMDKNTMESFVSYSKITQDTGAAAVTIKKSVDNLVREKYLNTRKVGRKIYYIFNNKRKFEPYSYAFLDRSDLTFTEKSYIVASQQYMFKDGESEQGRISYTNKELSNLIKMPESTISKTNRSLEAKGFLEGANLLTKTFNLRELDQVFIWKFKEQDEKIQENTDRIEELEKQVREISKINSKLLEENKKLKAQTQLEILV
jgi:DNA-binding MarR family transcriptional regulator